MRRLAILLLLFIAVAGSAHAADRTPRRFVMFFVEWSAALDGPADGVIAEAAQYAKAHPRDAIEVHGFADPTGSRKANALLSELRAQRVTDKLQDSGIPVSRIRQDAHGSVKFASTSLESRRVEIEIVPAR
jgi:outer membrane protein OmpA-like peptidoglycan-associated protein